MVAVGTVVLLVLIGAVAPPPNLLDGPHITAVSWSAVPLPRPRPGARELEPDGNAAIAAPVPLPQAKPSRRTPDEGQASALPRLAPDRLAACISSLEEAGVTAELLPPIREEPCGMHRPLQVAQIGEDDEATGLMPPAKIRCPLADALAQWITMAVQPAAKEHLGGRVTGLRVASSYVCRSRNHVLGARLSEHALGNAIDIGAFEIADEVWVAVGQRENQDAPDALFLSEVREAACRHFHTVLGPGSDAYHTDHFHLDMAHRGASGTRRYCK
jgi:hypothetical protein